jgi:hypothetical protein
LKDGAQWSPALHGELAYEHGYERARRGCDC